MKWYYAEGKKPVGPLDANEFRKLAENGAIKPESLVWRSGMKKWKPLSEVELPEEETPEPVAIEPVDSVAGERPMDSADAGDREKTGDEKTSGASVEIEAEYERIREDAKICAECGKSFSPDNMARYGDNWICRYCKSPFTREKGEGASAAGEVEYAGFMVRAGAKIIDIGILWAFGVALSVLLGPLFPAGPEKEPSIAFVVTVNVFQLIAAVIYTTYFLGRYSATPGKMACRLKVVTPKGDSISYGRACGRYFAEILSGLIFCIGYLPAIFDREKRTLHDGIVGTRVIRIG